MCKPCGPATVPGCSTAWARRTRICRATSCLCPGLPVNGAANWSNRFLPGIYQGCHMNLPIDYNPRTVLALLAESALSSPESQRRQLDFIQQLNAPADRAARPRAAARRPHRIVRDGVSHADRRPGSVRLEPGTTRTRQMYGLADARAATSSRRIACLARRLVERGVRVVQIYSGNCQPWDTHANNDGQHRQLARQQRSGHRGAACRT